MILLEESGVEAGDYIGGRKQQTVWRRLISYGSLSLLLVTVIILIVSLSTGNYVDVAHNGNNTANATAEIYSGPTLPNEFRPAEYEVNLTVDMVKMRYALSERLHVTMLGDSAHFVVHGRTLQVTSARMVAADGTVFALSEHATNEDLDYHQWRLSQAQRDHFLREQKKAQSGGLEGVAYVFEVAADGEISKGLSGFYQSTYKDESAANGTAVLAVTQFEATDARQAFFCFDEPRYKAPFTLAIAAARGWSVNANMRQEREVELAGGLVQHVFARSVPMSTYLVAFMVHKLGYVESTAHPNVVVRVYANPRVLDQADYALTATVGCLRFYEAYFGIAFPLDKLDVVAVPDFAAGAMENWGLITYRETALLLHPQLSTAADREWIMSVIAHELAHQWFGNLVTMQWWDNLWLNEGFAEFVQYLGSRYTDPTMDAVFSRFQFEERRAALLVDVLRTTHPVSNPKVADIMSIMESFDTITYQKGSSLVKMAWGYANRHMNTTTPATLGVICQDGDVFRCALSRYLTAYAYGNTVSSQLWGEVQRASAEFGDASPLDSSNMAFWTAAPGFPLVSASWTPQTRVLSLTQTPLSALDPQMVLADPKTNVYKLSSAERADMQSHVAAEATRKWWIPLGRYPIVSAAQPEQDLSSSTAGSIDAGWWYMTGANAQHDFSFTALDAAALTAGEQFVLVNRGGDGYFRTRYDDFLFGKVLAAMQAGDVTLDSDRAVLIDDAWALCFASAAPCSRAFLLGEYMFTVVAVDGSSGSSSRMREVDFTPVAMHLAGLMRFRSLYMSLMMDERSEPFAPTYNKFVAYLRRQLDAVLAAGVFVFGEQPELDHEMRLIKEAVLMAACEMDVPACVTAASALAQALIAAEGNATAEALVRFDRQMLRVVYATAVMNGGEREFAYMLRRYNTSVVPVEQQAALLALAMTRSHNASNTLLGLLLAEPAVIRLQDASTIVGGVARNPYSGMVAWEFLAKHFADFASKGTGYDLYSFLDLIDKTSARFVNLAQYTKLRTFVAELDNTYKLNATPMAARQAIEKVLINIQWRTKQIADIDTFFAGVSTV